MFTKSELVFLYQLLDQINPRGIEQKRIALMVMIKVKAMIKALEETKPAEPKPNTDVG